MNNTLNLNDWNKYIYDKKLKFINDIDQSNILDTSQDSFKFNDNLKDIIKINIFNISYIAFMTFKFLETSFIPSEIILNVIKIYSEDEMYSLLIKNRKFLKINNNNYKLDNHKYFKNLKFIINCIIEFVIKLEVCLNIQCLLFTDFIHKIHLNSKVNNNDCNNDCNNDDNSNLYNNNLEPRIFKLFIKSNKNITLNVKPSSQILLFLKLINKLSLHTYESDDFINFLNEIKYNDELHDTSNYNIYINKKNYINKKTLLYLDHFMLDITNFFLIDKTKAFNILDNNIYNICSKYILNNVELIFNNFENIFNILELHLLKSLNIDENKTKKLSYLRNVIKNLIDVEIDNIKKLFYV